MENTGGDSSWINVNNERHNIIIHNMVIAGLLDSNQHENKWCCTEDKSVEIHRFKTHSALDNTLPRFVWYTPNLSIRELRTFGCYIYPITSSPKKLYDRI